VSVDDAFDAEAVAVAEALDRCERSGACGGVGDRACDRMLGGMLERADEAQRVSLRP
jgi:hypothetical protein